MNTKTKPVKVLECKRCGNSFMTVGSEVIGLAAPRKVHINYESGEPWRGICPAHRPNPSEFYK